MWNYFNACPDSKLRTCIVVKGLNAVFMPQLSCDNLTIIQVKLNLIQSQFLDVLIGCPMISENHHLQEIKRLITYAENRGLDNSHHVKLGWLRQRPKNQACRSINKISIQR